MKRIDLALWFAPALPLAPLLLALTACGGEPEGQKGKRDAPSVPLGFELAFAGTQASAEADPAQTPLVALSPDELAARIKAGNVRVIDVRTDAEVAEGTIPGAEHIALDRFDAEALDLSDAREVVLYCRSGRRSAIAGEKLAAVTGQPVEHLEGGMLAWEAAGQPVQKPQGQ
ncbi:MAG: rhodanese-like domain-containing protein [Porphyrobacter sp.]|nr:rhodanese-like domain-containing protein [Porphyrobacter sp.]